MVLTGWRGVVCLSICLRDDCGVQSRWWHPLDRMQCIWSGDKNRCGREGETYKSRFISHEIVAKAETGVVLQVSCSRG